jgi:hypothetical protein
MPTATPIRRSRSYGKPNSYQRNRIAKLVKALKYADVPAPSTQGVAEGLMRRLEGELQVANGGPSPAPTVAQRNLVNELAGHYDFEPVTYAEADSLIKQFLAPSPYQLETRDDLIAELEYEDVPFPETAKAASAQIHRLITDQIEKLGYEPITSRQKRKLDGLAAKAGRKPYAYPKTKDEADEKIQKLEAARALREAAEGRELAAAA